MENDPIYEFHKTSIENPESLSDFVKLKVEKLCRNMELIRWHHLIVRDASEVAPKALDRGNILETLYKRELDLWRQITTLGLGLEGSDLVALRALVYEKFFAEQEDLAYFLNDGQHPGSYFTAENKKLRHLVFEAFCPKDIKDTIIGASAMKSLLPDESD